MTAIRCSVFRGGTSKGLYFLASNMGWLGWLRADVVWPLLLIAFGVWLILRRSWR